MNNSNAASSTAISLLLIEGYALTDMHLCLLIDPVELGSLVGNDLLRLEPQGNLFLGTVNSVRSVTDVAADILDALVGMLIMFD